jgi:hypothetical protein
MAYFPAEKISYQLTKTRVLAAIDPARTSYYVL